MRPLNSAIADELDRSCTGVNDVAKRQSLSADTKPARAKMDIEAILVLIIYYYKI
jgi:hypothetical protein